MLGVEGGSGFSFLNAKKKFERLDRLAALVERI